MLPPPHCTYYMVCSVPILTSFLNMAQGRKTHSKGVLSMAPPRSRLVIYAWHLNFYVSCICAASSMSAREGGCLSSKATTISARRPLSSFAIQSWCRSQLCLTQTTFPRTQPWKPLCCNARLESWALLQHTPALLLITPTNPGNFTVRPYGHAALHPTQRHGCTSSTAPLSLRDSHAQDITLDNTTGAWRLNGVSKTYTGSSWGLIVKLHTTTHNRGVSSPAHPDHRREIIHGHVHSNTWHNRRERSMESVMMSFDWIKECLYLQCILRNLEPSKRLGITPHTTYN